jgi:hypothetical protein
MKRSPLACVDCFTNTGFREILGANSGERAVCPRCGSLAAMVDAESLTEAMHSFFVSGSYIAETMASVYQINDRNPDPARFDTTLETDAQLACKLTGRVIFHYGPPLWRVGETDLKSECDLGGAIRTAALESLITIVPRITLPAGARLFRIRRNPEPDETIATTAAFDPPPITVPRSPGRWDDGITPMLYASDDIELCLHECRVTLADEIVVATLSCEREITLLDLTADIPFGPSTPFEDPNIFAAFLSLSRDEKWLDHARSLSVVARDAGLNGIRYTSYYAQAKHDSSALNVALFGRPLAAGMISLQSVNRIRLTDARYSYTFGPVLYNDSAMKDEMKTLSERCG